MFVSRETSERFFMRITARPLLALIITLIIIVCSAAGLSRLVKDTSVKAFIPAGHASLVADERATEVFGLSDSIAVAVLTEEYDGVFSPAVLELIGELTRSIEALSNVRADRVASLATESSIAGRDGELLVDPYLEQDRPDNAQADGARVRWQGMSPHRGTLVSEDGRGAVIMAELIDTDLADETYQQVRGLAANVDLAAVEIHVAGPGAVSGYLSRYIDQDARKLQPLVFALVLGFIFLAFRRLAALPGPLVVVLGAAGGALGVMAWAGVPYFAITNALPVILVAISVADAIHVLSTYYQYREQDPDADERSLVVRAMIAMVRPITLTTLTTVAGFLGIAAASIMPPITWFAWFAALGVALAWVFSILALPNVLLLLKPGHSPAFRSWRRNRPSHLGLALAHIGSFSIRNHRRVLVAFGLVALVALAGALQLRVDRSQVDNFAEGEPIRVADQLLNERFAGTAFLDVIVETDEVEGLLDARRMQKIADLQGYFERLPHVQKTVSIVDYLGLMHAALNEQPAAPGAGRALPESDAGIAQYLLVYEVSGDPADLEEEIDAGYQAALVRGILNSNYFSQSREVVEALQDYLDSSFNEPGMTATLAGDVNVSYHWMNSLQQSHFKGVALSLVLVLATSIIVFGSAWAGVVSVVPVAFTVLTLYAVMGYLGIYLEPATSMFAAIALGVGVDFAIHLVDRLRVAYQEFHGDLDRAVEEALPPVARACFYNSSALGLGFAVLMVSDLPTLQRFGGLVTVAAFSSYLVALVIVPAMVAAGRAVRGRQVAARRRLHVSISLLTLVLAATLLLGGEAYADPAKAQWVAENVAARQEGQAAKRTIRMTLTDRRGRERRREALVLKQSDDEVRKTRITYLTPKAVRDVTFLSHDHREAQGRDDRWLYLPATRKVRRVPASDRGDYFLGTDFTYEDIQSELKFDLDDYHFEYRGLQTGGGHLLSGTPTSEKTARQLGYGAFDAVVAEGSWMPTRVEFFDLKKKPLKTIWVRQIEQINGIWTATEILARNHQTGHQTLFQLEDIRYPAELAAQLFDAQGLSRGLPATLEN
ncbi:MAG: outer membrane lipoprotein-sorting protein [Xanthomonadales bacterium]|nr:outer membrane lipoprotein-sorting protein [Xanthomonadales bacterium]